MASVSSPPRPVGAAPSPVRHGTCRLTLRIGGTEYTLRPIRNQPGHRVVWVLKKLDPHGPAVHYSVALPKGEPAGCTCPDHEQRGSICKHIIALAARGLIARPKAARPAKARTRQIHARNARQSIAEARALPVEARRHLAEIGPALPEGWVPGGAHPSNTTARTIAAPASAASSFAAGFRQAVADHLARRNGTAPPAPESETGGFEICEGCGREFDPDFSRHPVFCEVLRRG